MRMLLLYIAIDFLIDEKNILEIKSNHRLTKRSSRSKDSNR